MDIFGQLERWLARRGDGVRGRKMPDMEGRLDFTLATAVTPARPVAAWSIRRGRRRPGRARGSGTVSWSCVREHAWVPRS